MTFKNASEFTGDYISKTNHFPSRQDIWDAATEAAKDQLTSHNSDYAKCSHVIGLICGTLGIEVSKCNESNLHDIYHKLVEMKQITRELFENFA
jgi:hypothetical protein